jgi:hypothetical protein
MLHGVPKCGQDLHEHDEFAQRAACHEREVEEHLHRAGLAGQEVAGCPASMAWRGGGMSGTAWRDGLSSSVHASGVASAAQGELLKWWRLRLWLRTMWMTGFTAGLAGGGGRGADPRTRARGRL